MMMKGLMQKSSKLIHRLVFRQRWEELHEIMDKRNDLFHTSLRSVDDHIAAVEAVHTDASRDDRALTHNCFCAKSSKHCGILFLGKINDLEEKM